MLESVIIETHPSPSACIIWLHGLGADGHDFTGVVNEMDLPSELGIRFVFPHAPVRPVTINNSIPMRAWYDIYSLNKVDREDVAGISQSQQEIEALIEVEKNKGISPDKIILAGFSQGGAIALHTGLRYSEKLAGIFGLSCYLPTPTSLTQEASLTNKNTPIFLAHGLQDSVLPFAFGKQTSEFLQQLNYPVEWHSYHMAHEVCIDEIEDLSVWLKKIFNTLSFY